MNIMVWQDWVNNIMGDAVEISACDGKNDGHINKHSLFVSLQVRTQEN